MKKITDTERLDYLIRETAYVSGSNGRYRLWYVGWVQSREYKTPIGAIDAAIRAEKKGGR